MYGMHKTTVYLPDDLRDALRRAARAAGRSEADLVREGVRLVAEGAPAPEPTIPLGRSDDPHLAENVDRILDREFGAD